MLIKAILVDKDDLFRRILRTLLQGYKDVKVIGEASNAAEALTLIGERKPQVVLWDVNTLDAGNLPKLTQVAKAYPDLRIIVLSVAERDHTALEAFRRGACGHLVKGKSTPVEVIEAIRKVTNGQSIIGSAMAGWILDEMAQQRNHRS